MRILALLVGLACAGCAPARVSAPPATPLAAADALLRDGCYDCLLEARAIYDDAAAGAAAPGLASRRFEIAILIALREVELGLDHAASLARAESLAARIPDPAAATQVLALVRDLRPDPATLSFHSRPTGPWVAPRPPDEQRYDWLASAPISPDVAQYLAIAASCDEAQRGRRSALADAEPGANAPASDLVAYRAGICRPRNRDDLAAIRARSPRFVELALFQARTEMRAIQDGGAYRARTFVAEAYARFPNSPAVTYLRGQVLQLGGDCRAAVSAYDETLALNPGHEQAILGRAICLSYLKRHDEAIDAATTLIGAATPNQGEAWYWRAWNRRELKDLATARIDVERAKQLVFNTTVLTLAGMIAHDQDDLPAAERDLREAVAVGPTNCTASWYLALVHLKQKAWAPGAATFATAMECYDGAARDTEKRKAAVLAQKDFDLDPAYVAQQVAGFDAAIAEDRAQQSASAYNAAVNYARARDYVTAGRYADLAARDPARLVMVEELRKVMAAASAPR